MNGKLKFTNINFMLEYRVSNDKFDMYVTYYVIDEVHDDM